MAAGDTMQATPLLDSRVPLREPGQYRLLCGERGELVGIAFILPNGTRGRLAATGHGKDGEPEWDISVSGYDGSVTVSPSIEAVGVWHGYLERGVWREV